MTPTTPTFGTPVIGQTEKALDAILERQLAGTGLTEPQWVTLTLTVASGGTVDLDQLVDRVAAALKVSEAEAYAYITELATAQLLLVSDGEESPVKLTDAGQQLQGQIRAAVARITERLWGDLPAEDLATAGRVLSIVLARANAELAVTTTSAVAFEDAPERVSSEGSKIVCADAPCSTLRSPAFRNLSGGGQDGGAYGLEGSTGVEDRAVIL
jgi:DNA-binding MarR family transcriptional regulator